MIDNKKKNIGFFIIVITILLLIVVITGVVFLLKKVDYKKGIIDDNKVEEKNNCDISLSYYVDTYYLFENEIELTDEDEKKFNEVLENLEFSEPIEGMNRFKYHLKYCDTELIIGDDKTITKGNDNVEIVKGYEELANLLEEQEKKINKVFLYEIDLTKQDESEIYKEIEMTDEDKNKIKELWNNQEKNIEYIDLSILFGKRLVIEEDSFDISLSNPYVYYKDGYVRLDDGIIEILKNYITDGSADIEFGLKYTINNDMDSMDSKYSDRGVYYATFNKPNSPHYYTIASGTKGSSGYSIAIDKVNIDKDGNVEILVKEESLKEGEIGMTVLTYPVCQIEFNMLPKSIVVKDEKGEEFKHLNF